MSSGKMQVRTCLVHPTDIAKNKYDPVTAQMNRRAADKGLHLCVKNNAYRTCVSSRTTPILSTNNGTRQAPLMPPARAGRPGGDVTALRQQRPAEFVCDMTSWAAVRPQDH